MDPVDLVRLRPLMDATSGAPEVRIALIDGPVAATQTGLVTQGLHTLAGTDALVCDPSAPGMACRHGTFVASILKARRDTATPGICPDATLHVRPIFWDAPGGGLSTAGPRDLADALADSLEAGARLINLSSMLIRASHEGNRIVIAALREVSRRDAILVTAAGNEGVVAGSSITAHPSAIPVVAYGLDGRVSRASNVGHSIGLRGLGAPGEGIKGLGIGDGTAIGGTSVAAPFVTGTLALLWSLFPDATAAELRAALRVHAGAKSVVPPLLDASAAYQHLSALFERRRSPLYSSANFHDRGGHLVPAVTGLRHGALTPAQDVSADGAAVPDPGAAGDTNVGYVYAIGRVELQFRDTSVEREFTQALARTSSESKTDQEALRGVLTARENRYIARQLCYILSIEGIETYLLVPEVPEDYDLLLDAIRSEQSPDDVDVAVGILGPVAPPEMCNGRQLPIVQFSQLYSFTRRELVEAMPRPESVKKAEFDRTANDLLGRVMQIADNAGSTDEHRALNYLSVRYSDMYAAVVEAHGRSQSLASIEARPSRLSSTERIVDVIFTLTDRQTTAVEKQFVRVNVSGMFPFLVTPLQPFFER